MNEYLMAIYHFFSGYEQFTIEAENKDDALVKARAYAESNVRFWGGNYDFNRIICVKKINKKKKKKDEDGKLYKNIFNMD